MNNAIKVSPYEAPIVDRESSSIASFAPASYLSPKG